MISWDDVEDAIQQWIVATSGLADDHVFWVDQEGPRVSTPYISLSVLTVQPVGQDWVDTEYDEAGDPGEEYIFKQRGNRRVTISIQCFGGQPTGQLSPRSILNTVVSKHRLPSAAALADMGIGIASFTAVKPISGVINSSIFEPRAVCEATFFLSEEVAEFGTYIDTVELNQTAPVENQTIIELESES